MDRVLVGRWRLAEMELWDRDALDLVEPAFLEIRADGTGLIGFIAISATLDARSDGTGRLEFSWEGDDEGHPVSGRGVGHLNSEGDMEGRIFIHLGDDSSFLARRG